MTQVDIIRAELLKGNTLTQRSALMDFGIMALPRRIADLKEQGFPVASTIKTNPMTGQRYAQYSLDVTVKSISELKEDCVYRMVVHKQNPFHSKVFEKSNGYAVVQNVVDEIAEVQMAGCFQVISQGWLDDGHVEVRYVGGLQ